MHRSSYCGSAHVWHPPTAQVNGKEFNVSKDHFNSKSDQVTLGAQICTGVQNKSLGFNSNETVCECNWKLNY